MPGLRYLLTGTVLLGALLGGALLRPGEAEPLVHTIHLDQHGSVGAATLDEQWGRAFIVDRLDDSVSVLDTRTGTLVRTTALSAQPAGVYAISARVDMRTQHLFVSCDDGSVQMLDARNGALLRTVIPSQGISPSQVALSSSSSRLFILTETTIGNALAVADTRGGRVLRVAPSPYIRITTDLDSRGHLYAIDYGSNAISILDGRTGALLATHPVTGGAPGGFSDILIDARNDLLYLIGMGANRIYTLKIGTWHPLSTLQMGGVVQQVQLGGVPARLLVLDGSGSLELIDASRGKVLRTFPPRAGHTVAYAADPPSDRLFVAAAGWVQVVRISTGGAVGAIRIGRQVMTGLALNPTTGHLLAMVAGTSAGGGTVWVLDIRADTAIRSIPIGVAPVFVGTDRRARLAYFVDAGSDLSATTVQPVSRNGGLLAWLHRWLPLIPATGSPLPPGIASVVQAGSL